MSEYPEHDKLDEVKDDSQAIGTFLDFDLPRLGLHLCEHRERSDAPRWIHQDTGERVDFAHPAAIENPDWYPEGFYRTSKTIEAILAETFGIDSDKLEAEKRQMLEALRAANA